LFIFNFFKSTQLAPRCFCGQAAPFASLKNKLIAPQCPSIVTNVITPYEDQTITIHDNNFKIITLPGHTPGSIGVITPDNVLYSGDALFGEATFNKHPILFYTDIGQTLKSFKKLAQLNVQTSVLYHGGMITDLAKVVQNHEARILETKDVILHSVKQNINSIDTLTQKIMQLYAIPNSVISFTLTQTTVRAYLSHLEAEKIIEIKVIDGLLQAVSL